MDLAGITTKKKKNDTSEVSWLKMYPFFPLNFGEGTQNHDVKLIDASRRVFLGGRCYVHPSTYRPLCQGQRVRL